MPNKRQTKEIVEADLQIACDALTRDFKARSLTLFVRRTEYYPFVVYASCETGEGEDRELHIGIEFYTTVRFPSLVFVQWKAVNNLYNQLERRASGLCPCL